MESGRCKTEMILNEHQIDLYQMIWIYEYKQGQRLLQERSIPLTQQKKWMTNKQFAQLIVIDQANPSC